jgi:hypothetical protein
MLAKPGWPEYPLQGVNLMSKMIVMAFATLFAANLAYAAESCEAQATAKKLAGAAKSSFMKKCQADAKVGAPGTCDAQAAEKKLAGAAKTSFVKKCESDVKAAGASASCEAQAAEKKLAGAAKTSFVKKCVADAK